MEPCLGFFFFFTEWVSAHMMCKCGHVCRGAQGTLWNWVFPATFTGPGDQTQGSHDCKANSSPTVTQPKLLILD